MKIFIIIVIILLIFTILFTKVDGKKDFKTETINTLMRQSARWSTAAAQDQNVLIAVLHSNYGAGYIWALRDIATDEEIQKVTGVDVLKFRDEVTKIQDLTTKRMAQLCPKFAPTESYLAKIAGEL